jgi:Anti-sigma factor NepR
MRRRDRPTQRRASDHPIDPLDEALRQIGADVLNEPVPDRLLQVLRGLRGESEGGPEAGPAEPPQGAGRR